MAEFDVKKLKKNHASVKGDETSARIVNKARIKEYFKAVGVGVVGDNGFRCSEDAIEAATASFYLLLHKAAKRCAANDRKTITRYDIL